MKFDCGMCNGLCCVTPPSMSSEEEIVFAKEKGAKLVAVKDINSDGFIVSVSKEAGKCPFIKDGKCSVYEDRFRICREYICDELDKNIEDVKPYPDLVHCSNEITFNAFDKAVVLKHNLDIVDLNTYTTRVLSTDLKVLVLGAADVACKIEERKDAL